LQTPKNEEVLDLQSKYTSKTAGELAQGEEGLPDVVEQVEPELD
jgi:hypothetical protein